MYYNTYELHPSSNIMILSKLSHNVLFFNVLVNVVNNSCVFIAG